MITNAGEYNGENAGRPPRYSDEFFDSLIKNILKAAGKFKSEIEKIPIEEYDFLVTYASKDIVYLKKNKKIDKLTKLLSLTDKVLKELDYDANKSNKEELEEDEEVVEMSNNAEATRIDLEDKEEKDENLEEKKDDI